MLEVQRCEICHHITYAGKECLRRHYVGAKPNKESRNLSIFYDALEMSYKDIAKKYNLSLSSIYGIVLSFGRTK